MPKEGIDPKLFAPCGMNCMVCYKHCRSKNPCAGCLSGDRGKPDHCRKCKIRDCSREQGAAYCFACAGYPCKLIKNLEKSYNQRYQASLVENGEFVRLYGLPAFMEKQKEQYTCAQCGGVISMHDRTCSACRRGIQDGTPDR